MHWILIHQRMAKVVHTVMIKDGGDERAVKVTVDAPNPEELDTQYLARRAWFTRSKKLKRGTVKVKVEKIGR